MICYVVTDIGNVARFLSFGCLGPRTIYDEKYRPDVSMRHGDALVLFEDLHLAAREAARSEGAVAIIELQGDFLASMPGTDGVILTGSLIPASSIQMLYFRDETTQREFRTLAYRNVDPTVLEQVVTADAFVVLNEDITPSAPSPGTTQATLAMEDSAPTRPLELVSARKVEDIDRSVGALAALLRPLRPSTALLRRATDLVGTILHAVTGSDAAIGTALVAKPERPLHDDICSVIRSTTHEDVGYDDILMRLKNKYSEFEDELAGIREMLSATRDVIPEQLSSPCLRALLIALVGQNPKMLHSLPLEKLPDEPETELLALWYAGLREGGARRPVEERLGEFEAVLQAWAARQGTAGVPPEIPVFAFKPKVRSVVTDERFEYFLEQKSLRVGPILRRFPPLLQRLKDFARENERSGLALARSLKLPVVTTIVFTDAVAFSLSDSRLCVDVAHRVEQQIDAEVVCRALDEAKEDDLYVLGARHLPLPTKAP